MTRQDDELGVQQGVDIATPYTVRKCGVDR
jgi:hypothetical protein